MSPTEQRLFTPFVAVLAAAIIITIVAQIVHAVGWTIFIVAILSALGGTAALALVVGGRSEER